MKTKQKNVVYNTIKYMPCGIISVLSVRLVHIYRSCVRARVSGFACARWKFG